jgi:hypothetical protein
MDFLPQVKMDFIPSDNESEVDEDNIEENIDDFNEDKDISQEEINEDKVEKIVPKAKSKREDMNVEDIFNLPNDKVIIQNPNVKLTKKGKPRKQRPPMSEEHKEKLKLAREKAMASRKAKAQEKKEAKELEKQEKELLKKQKVKRVQQLKQEVEQDDKPKILKEPSQKTSFTKEDLEEASLKAIMNYEKIRKTRKEEKKIKQQEEKEQEILKARLRRAVTPQQEYNPFNGCY